MGVLCICAADASVLSGRGAKRFNAGLAHTLMNPLVTTQVTWSASTKVSDNVFKYNPHDAW